MLDFASLKAMRGEQILLDALSVRTIDYSSLSLSSKLKDVLGELVYYKYMNVISH